MSLIEFLLFIPLLIYGIALSNLLSQWKRLLDFARWHAPFLLTVVMFTEVAIWNIYTFLEVFTQRTTHPYVSYLADLSAPMTFMLAVNALLPKEDEDHEVNPQEFASRIRPAYFFMGTFVALHLLPQFRSDDGELWIRLPAILLLFATSWFRKNWLIYVLGATWAVGLVYRVTAFV